MNAHKLDLAVEIAGTACLYNLTKGKVGEGIHPNILRDVVNTTLTAMKNFPTHAQVKKIFCFFKLLIVTFKVYYISFKVIPIDKIRFIYFMSLFNIQILLVGT